MTTRQARYRERQRDGRMVVPLEVAPEVTAELVAAGLLSEQDIDDRGKVSQAISRAFDLLISVTRNFPAQ